MIIEAGAAGKTRTTIAFRNPSERTTLMDLGNDRGLIPMTRTEMKCLRLSAGGMSDQDIGERLELTVQEVASVLSVVMLKLRVPNRMAGLAKAARMGLLKDSLELSQNGNGNGNGNGNNNE